MYATGSDAPEDDFLARNGLRYGKIYGFAVDMSEDGPTEGMFRDDYHKPRENGAKVEGKFVAINWQWDGVVKNFRHDGAWDFQLEVPGYEGTEWRWWNAAGYDDEGAKTEHVSPDTRPGITGFVLGSTAGYFGHYYIHGVAEALGSSKNGLPAEFDSTYYVYQGENDVSGQINLGGAGKYNRVEECPDANDATMNCDGVDSVKNTFEDVDGLEVINSAEGLFAVIQEDSGNRLGERMFITKLEHEGTELEYFFIAQSGGTYNTRMMNGVGIPAESNDSSGTHEFSGILDLSGMLMGASRRKLEESSSHNNEPVRGLKADKKKGGEPAKKERMGDYVGPIRAGNGYAKRMAESMVSICDKIIAINLQAHNLYDGPLAAFQADRGGQVMAFQPDICEAMRK